MLPDHARHITPRFEGVSRGATVENRKFMVFRLS